MTNWDGGSPGYSIDSVLKGMSDADLMTLMDPELAVVLRGLDPNLSGRESLAAAVLELEGAGSLVNRASSRSALIRHLPLGKAEELLGRLGSGRSKDPYDALREQLADPSTEQLSIVSSFFGLAETFSSQAPQVRSVSPSTVDAGFGLFSHQRLTLRAVTRALGDAKTVLLHMPTGSGKTRTAMHLIAAHLKERETGLVFWVSEQPEVLEQAAHAFETAWHHVGDRSMKIYRLYGTGDIDLEEMESGFVLGGFKKLHSLQSNDENLLLRLGDRTTLVVVDEAHQAIAPTYNSVIRALSRKRPATRLLGLTATPGRTWSDVDEDYRLSEFFEGRKVTLLTGDKRNPIRYLIDEGYLANPTFRHLELGLQSDGDEHRGDLDNVQLIQEILDMLNRHTRLLVFAASVPHARLISAILRYRQVDAGLITAETPSGERNYLFHKFRQDSAKQLVLVNYGVLTTGFDAPAASGAIIARSTRSLVLFSQMVGRVLRGPQAGGTTAAEILTTVDTSLPGFGSVREAFANWEDVWNE